MMGMERMRSLEVQVQVCVGEGDGWDAVLWVLGIWLGLILSNSTVYALKKLHAIFQTASSVIYCIHLIVLTLMFHQHLVIARHLQQVNWMVKVQHLNSTEREKDSHVSS